ncbi:hypothetical protein ID866_10363 [Astraeus odoratus]|nr:hypothetical protein ID866_10363 [Astraeus odoratus]
MSEDSKTLDALLRFCYPCTLAEDPALHEFRDIFNVLEAAKKYSLDAIEKRVCRALIDTEVLEKDSLRSFAVVHRAHLRDESMIAARHTLREPLIPTWFEEIDLLTSSDLLGLLAYHQRCASDVQVLQSDLSWISDHYEQWRSIPWMFGMTPHGSSCECPVSPFSKYALFDYNFVKWFEDFMDTTFLALRDRPCAETIQSNVEKAVQTARQRDCYSCSSLLSGGMQEFATVFKRKLDEVIAKVGITCFSRKT